MKGIDVLLITRICVQNDRFPDVTIVTRNPGSAQAPSPGHFEAVCKQIA